MLFIIKMFLSLPCSAEVKQIRTGKFSLAVHGDSSGSCTGSAVFCPSPAPEKDSDAVRSFGGTARVGICLVLSECCCTACLRSDTVPNGA